MLPQPTTQAYIVHDGLQLQLATPRKRNHILDGEGIFESCTLRLPWHCDKHDLRHLHYTNLHLVWLRLTTTYPAWSQDIALRTAHLQVQVRERVRGFPGCRSRQDQYSPSYVLALEISTTHAHRSSFQNHTGYHVHLRGTTILHCLHARPRPWLLGSSHTVEHPLQERSHACSIHTCGKQRSIQRVLFPAPQLVSSCLQGTWNAAVH